MTLVLIYFQRALLLTHHHLMPQQKYVRLWFIIQLQMPVFLCRVQSAFWYLLDVKNCKKLFVCKSARLNLRFRAVFNFALYMIDGEVRIRNYFNDFKHLTKTADDFKQLKNINIARGTTDPAYWVWNLSDVGEFNLRKDWEKWVSLRKMILGEKGSSTLRKFGKKQDQLGNKGSHPEPIVQFF